MPAYLLITTSGGMIFSQRLIPPRVAMQIIKHMNSCPACASPQAELAHEGAVCDQEITP